MYKAIKHIAQILSKNHTTRGHSVYTLLNDKIISRAQEATKQHKQYELNFRGQKELFNYEMMCVSFTDYLGYTKTGKIKKQESMPTPMSQQKAYEERPKIPYPRKPKPKKENDEASEILQILKENNIDAVYVVAYYADTNAKQKGDISTLTFNADQESKLSEFCKTHKITGNGNGGYVFHKKGNKTLESVVLEH